MIGRVWDVNPLIPSGLTPSGAFLPSLKMWDLALPNGSTQKPFSVLKERETDRSEESIICLEFNGESP